MSNWYYAFAGKILGPITVEDIDNLREKGKIDSETLIWNDIKQGEWLPLHSQDALRSTSSAPPPLPPSHINHFWAWSMALWSLFGSAFDIFLKQANGNVPSWIFLIVYFIPTTIFVRADQIALKKSGRPYFAKGFFWIIFLIPIYLFRRATVLRQPKTLFFISITTTLMGSALLSFMEQSGTYLGPGIPPCLSSASIAQIKSIFLNLPKNVHKASVIEVKAMQEVSSTSKERICRFIAHTSDLNTYNGRLSITDTDDKRIYYELRLEK